LSNIQDPKYRKFAQYINRLWGQLGREIKESARENPDQHSLIYVSNPFIVPGGRFNEFHYWDSYFIQKGLLVSGMNTTARGMLENFLELVEELGYVPSGGRVYYQRSQPPLLISMFDDYYRATKDDEFLKTSLPILEKEFKHWYSNRSIQVKVDGKSYKMFHYDSKKTEPRPECYRQVEQRFI